MLPAIHPWIDDQADKSELCAIALREGQRRYAACHGQEQSGTPRGTAGTRHSPGKAEGHVAFVCYKPDCEETAGCETMLQSGRWVRLTIRKASELSCRKLRSFTWTSFLGDSAELRTLPSAGNIRDMSTFSAELPSQTLRVSNVVSYVLLIAVNVASNTGILGPSNAEISQKYSTPLTPAG